MNITPGNMPARRQERVAVYFDYENVHRTGHGLYAPYGSPVYATPPHPKLLAERLVGKRNRPSILSAAKVFRGRPIPEHQPEKAASFDILHNEWSADGVTTRKRDLKYTIYDDGSFDVQEKGIDVALAVELVEDALSGAFDAQIVFTCDTDILPAIELVYKLPNAHVELACWSGAKRLYLDAPRRLPFCHFLNEKDFTECRSRRAGDL